MGIPGLVQYIKKNIDSLFQEGMRRPFYRVPITWLSGKKIAVDSNLYAHAVTSRVTRKMAQESKDPTVPLDRNILCKDVMGSFVNFIDTMRRYDISLVFVWDGRVNELKKEFTQKKRRAYGESTLEMYTEVCRKIEESGHGLFRDKGLMEEARRLLGLNIFVSSIDVKYYVSALEEIGIPTMFAAEDAEKLCSDLSASRIVDAVWSADSDIYLMGSSFMVGDIDYKSGGVPTVEIGDIDVVCKYLESIAPKIEGFVPDGRKMMVDVGIMSGTDYNYGLEGVGITTAMKHITSCGNIENIINYGRSPALREKLCKLDYVKIREIFEPHYVDPTDVNVTCDNDKYRKNSHIHRMQRLPSYIASRMPK